MSKNVVTTGIAIAVLLLGIILVARGRGNQSGPAAQIFPNRLPELKTARFIFLMRISILGWVRKNLQTNDVSANFYSTRNKF